MYMIVISMSNCNVFQIYVFSLLHLLILALYLFLLDLVVQYINMNITLLFIPLICNVLRGLLCYLMTSMYIVYFILLFT